MEPTSQHPDPNNQVVMPDSVNAISQPDSSPVVMDHVNAQSPMLTPIVKNLSPRGLEYFLMMISLAIAAFSLGAVLHSAVDQMTGAESTYFTDSYSLGSAALIVALPLFAFFFIRLKRLELKKPEVKADASRNRMVQLAVVVSFFAGVINLINYAYSLLNGSESSAGINPLYWLGFYSDESKTSSALGNFLHMAITLVIAGGIFTYFWLDQRKRDRS